MFVQLRNEAGYVKIAKIGFSWTMLFFWFFTPMFRGDWLHMILSMLLGYLTRGASLFIYPFVYNRLYIMGLLAGGWGPLRAEDREILEMKGFKVRSSYTYQDYSGGHGFSGSRSYSGDEAGQGEESWEEEEGYLTAEDWEDEKSQAVDAEWKDG